jgi:hypothetical protein
MDIEDVQRLPVLVRVRDTHQRHQAVLGAQAPQRAVRGIEDDVADARRREQLARAAGAQVERHQVPVLAVVGRVEQRPRLGIEREP